MNRDIRLQQPLTDLLGIKVTHVAPDRVEGELAVRGEVENRFGVLQGGALMALADTLGGIGTIANLPQGARTATIESKTNFLAGIPLGDTARAECTALHRGRRTMVWQTRVTRNDGKLCAIVLQTQMVIPADKT